MAALWLITNKGAQET